ncbi:MAG: hypothetical protein K6V97_00630 [Actinomycetia bacterium]|nr:hypothetical protein [Actinomycetes bacterium]
MAVVQDIHLVTAILLLAGALVLGVLALLDRPRGHLSDRFWRGAAHFERLMLFQAVLGVALYLTGARAASLLHYVYGGVVLVVLALGRGLRPGAGLRSTLEADYGRFNEPVILAVLWFFTFGLLARATMTGLWGV